MAEGARPLIRYHVAAMVRRLFLVLAGAATLSGCFTTWATTQVVAGRPPFDENSREAAVPLPGVVEALTVTLHPRGKPLPVQSSTTAPAAQPVTATEAATGADRPVATTTPAPRLELECQVSQSGRESVYRASTRYGRKWKWTTAIMFVLEGAYATVALLDDDAPLGVKAAGGWMAIDALGTAVLFFAPRRDIYERSERPVGTVVRHDCPEGLMLELDGRPVPVDALGGVGELGEALFVRHLTGESTPGTAALRLRLGDHAEDIPIDAADRCAWLRARQHAAAATACNGVTSTGRSVIVSGFRVPLGTLTGAPPAPAPGP